MQKELLSTEESCEADTFQGARNVVKGWCRTDSTVNKQKSFIAIATLLQGNRRIQKNPFTRPFFFPPLQNLILKLLISNQWKMVKGM